MIERPGVPAGVEEMQGPADLGLGEVGEEHRDSVSETQLRAETIYLELEI